MKYRKKPVVIEAVKLNSSYKSIKDCLVFMGQIVKSDTMTVNKFDEYVRLCNHNNGVKIKTLEGEMLASFGDYIIKGVNGEFYPCKPDIFRKTYELVE